MQEMIAHMTKMCEHIDEMEQHIDTRPAKYKSRNKNKKVKTLIQPNLKVGTKQIRSCRMETRNEWLRVSLKEVFIFIFLEGSKQRKSQGTDFGGFARHLEGIFAKSLPL